jgi:predicted transcriptional regulator
MEITNYITTDLKPLTAKTIGTVKDFFDDLNFSHFPVVEEGVYIGSIV